MDKLLHLKDGDIVTIKQLKKKLVRSMVEPELIYMPVEEKKDEPFTIEIEVAGSTYKPSASVDFFSTSGFLNNLKNMWNNIEQPYTQYPYDETELLPWYFYQKDAFLQSVFFIINPTYNGTLITPEKFPELFRKDIDFDTLTYTELVEKGGLLAHPVIHKTSNIDNEIVLEQFSKQLTVYVDTFTSTVDWGDGTIDNFTPETVENTIKVIINGEVVEIKYQTFTNNSYIHHYYNQDGNNNRYTIKIRSKCLIAPSINPPYQSYRKVISWGMNNNIRILNSISTNILESIPHDCTALKNIVSASYFFAYFTPDTTSLPIEQWQERVINMIQSIPYLIDATSMFNHSDSNFKGYFTKIPDCFFQKNKYLILAPYCFQNMGKNIEHIGNSVFANLPFLINANNSFYIMAQEGLKTIGDSIFENDWLLCSVNPIYLYRNVNLNSVGNYIFKNCHSLTSVEDFIDFSHSLRTVGKGLFENCYNLKHIDNVCSQCYLLEYIGEDIFKNCKNLVYVSNIFDESYALNKLPDKFFYDLEWTEEREHGFYWNNPLFDTGLGGQFDEYGKFIDIGVGDIEVEQEVCDRWDFYTIPVKYLPKDLINPQFIKDCALQGKTVLFNLNNSSLSYVDTNGVVYYRTMLGGYAPDFWNYTNYGIPYSPSNTEVVLPFGQFNYKAFYGYQRRNDSEYVCINEWVNYDEIPTEHLITYD